MRILVECSYVFNHPNVKSGIQRVVRNVVANLASVESPVEVLPVSFRKNELLRVTKLEAGEGDKAIAPIRTRLEGARHRYWRLYDFLESRLPFEAPHNLRRTLYGLMKLFGLVFFIPLKLIEFYSVRYLDPKRSELIEAEEGDVLVLLDSSWNQEFFAPVEALKSKGIKVVSVVYDLIPITHPQFYDARMIDMFQNWIDWTSRNADGYMAISKTVEAQVVEYIEGNAPEAAGNSRWFSSFYLGSELDEARGETAIRPDLKLLCEGERPVYLTVSTIEPRKNQAYQLDAFDRLWAEGYDVCLCIVGKIGWKCDALIRRIQAHPELNERLFMFNDLDDDELNFAYQGSAALLFSSFVEGFGLPLVEASQRGLRVMCSDIPIFREIGGESYAYFNLEDPSSLGRLVKSFEADGIFPAEAFDGSWQSWEKSTAELVAWVYERSI